MAVSPPHSRQPCEHRNPFVVATSERPPVWHVAPATAVPAASHHWGAASAQQYYSPFGGPPNGARRHSHPADPYSYAPVSTQAVDLSNLPLGEIHPTSSGSSSKMASLLRAAMVLVTLIMMCGAAWRLGGTEGVRLPRIFSPFTSGAVVATDFAAKLAANPTVLRSPSSAAALRSVRNLDPDSPRVVLRILCSGSSHHAELDRLLQSLQAATYEIGVDLIDVEILIDPPRAITDEHAAAPAPTDGNGGGAAASHRRLFQSVEQIDPHVIAAKYERDLYLLLARNFQWVHGSVTIRAVDTVASHLGGFFNQFVSWTPSASLGGPDEEFALVLRETNVVAPSYFQAIKRLLRTHFSRAEPTGLASPTLSDALIGMLLEPAELVLGVEADAPYTPRSPDLMFQHNSDDASAASLVFAQQASSFSAGGGLLLRARHFLPFKAWVMSRGLIARDAAHAHTTRGAPSATSPRALVYAPSTVSLLGALACVPGLVSNGWFPRGDGASAHRERVEGPWFTLGLLHRFMRDRGLLTIHPVFPPLPGSSEGAVLITSSAFEVSHAHHEHIVTDITDETLANARLESTRAPLPPLRRELVRELDAATYDPSMPSLLYDFAGRPFQLRRLQDLKSVGAPPTAPAIDADCFTAPGSPSQPPAFKSKTGHGATLESLLSPSSTGESEPSGPVNLAVPQEELLALAHHTAASTSGAQIVVPVSPGSDGGGGGGSGTAEQMVDLTPAELRDLAASEVRRWEEYELDYQMRMQHITAPEEVSEARSKHESLVQEHDTYLARIREELDKKKLLASLRNQIGAIETAVEEKKIEAKLAAYREKKRRIKEHEDRQKMLAAEQQQKEDEEAKAKKAQEEEKKKEEERQQQEAAAKAAAAAAEEEEKKRREEEEEEKKKKKKEEEEKRRREDEERRRKEEEEKKRHEEEERRRHEEEEEEKKRREDEEKRRNEEEEKKRREDEEKRRSEEDEKKRHDDEEKRRKEDEELRRHEEDEKKRKEAEEQKRQQEQQDAKNAAAKKEEEEKSKKDAAKPIDTSVHVSDVQGENTATPTPEEVERILEANEAKAKKQMEEDKKAKKKNPPPPDSADSKPADPAPAPDSAEDVISDEEYKRLSAQQAAKRKKRPHNPLNLGRR